MRKIYVSKWLKYLLVLVLVIGGGVSGVFAYRTYSIPQYKEIEVTKYSHEWSEEIHWLGKLVTTPVFPKSELENDDFVYRDFTKLLKVDFVSRFRSNKEIEMKGKLYITAYLEAQYGQDKSILWTRSYPVIQEESFEFVGQSYDFTQHVDIDLVEPRKLLEKISEEFTVGASYVYRIVYSVDASINDSGSIYPFNIGPSLEIPIVSAVGTNTVVTSEVLEYANKQMVEELIPVNMNLYYSMLILSISCIVIGLILLIVLRAKPDKDEFDRFCIRLIREHEDRMVKLPVALSLHHDVVLTMTSVEDMVKTADELSQPIFYYVINEKVERKVELYIFDDVRIYYFVKMGVIGSIENDLALESLDIGTDE